LHVIVRASEAGKFDGVSGGYTRIAIGDQVDGWQRYADAHAWPADFFPDGETRATDTLLLYFISGTTALLKLVEHTHVSYPVGHLSTMYWIGLQPGDVHLNVSSPGWAKHAYSNVFAPWIAQATVFVYNFDRFDAAALLEAVRRAGVTTFCAPPTVWRMLIQLDLSGRRGNLREVLGAGEPLNPEVIEQVRQAWGLTVRDGYGQTETTAQISNSPGQPIKRGSMGHPLPGYSVALIDPVTGQPGDEGETCLDLSPPPLGLMAGYQDDEGRTAESMRDGCYHTGDLASRDAEGSITYIGRNDDVFKSSDYRISPFELESVLLEHVAIVEAAVVPSPDPLRLAVPKAYIVLAGGHQHSGETVLSILRYARDNLAPYKRVRRVEFADCPRRFQARSAGWSCVVGRSTCTLPEPPSRASGARKTSPNYAAKLSGSIRPTQHRHWNTYSP
jgi:acetyl-CoA synthetase